MFNPAKFNRFLRYKNELLNASDSFAVSLVLRDELQAGKIFSGVLMAHFSNQLMHRELHALKTGNTSACSDPPPPKKKKSNRY
jgi:uncharacterized membrane protein